MGNAGGVLFGRKKKKFEPPSQPAPLTQFNQIINNLEAQERISTAIKFFPPGHIDRWEKILSLINRQIEPTEEVPTPMILKIDDKTLQDILNNFFNEVKYISSDGLALARNYLPLLYDKHSQDVCRRVSQKERDERGLVGDNFAYGELDSDIFATMYLKVISVYGFKDQGIFCDLGCGVGNVVFTSAFIGNFQKVRGIEYLYCLLERGEKRLHRWNHYKTNFPQKIQNIEFEFKEDDFALNDSWSDSNFILLHWTTFSEDIRKTIIDSLEKCQEGTQIITFTYPIICPSYRILLKDTCDSSWGKAEFFFHEKVREIDQSILGAIQSSMPTNSI